MRMESKGGGCAERRQMVLVGRKLAIFTLMKINIYGHPKYYTCLSATSLFFIACFPRFGSQFGTYLKKWVLYKP